jgi:NADH-quinone oxidoreductase subunit F
VQTLRRIVAGAGRQEDLDTLLDLCQNITGRTVCAFGDALIAPVVSTIKHWRPEYEELIRQAESTRTSAVEAVVGAH